MGEHYSKEITEANAKVYQAGLSDLGAEELEVCCTKALQECRFMPTVADIRAYLRRCDSVGERSGCDVEWAGIVDQIVLYTPAHDGFLERWGSKGPPRLSEAGRYAVRCIGGYPVIASTQNKHLPLLRKQFAELYERFHERKRLDLPVPEVDSLPTRDEKLIPMPDEIREKLAAITKRTQQRGSPAMDKRL